MLLVGSEELLGDYFDTYNMIGEYLRLLELQLQTMGPPPEERLIS